MHLSGLSRAAILSMVALIFEPVPVFAQDPIDNIGPTLGGGPNLSPVTLQRRGVATTSVIDGLSDPGATDTGSISTVGDDLGNHNAAGDLRMNGNRVMGAAEVHSDHVFSLNYFYFSDETLKQDIQTLTGDEATDLVRSMRPVRYVLRSSGKPAMGVIAQEMELILPDIVRTGEDGIKSVDYIQLISPLIATIQQLEARVSELEAATAP